MPFPSGAKALALDQGIFAARLKPCPCYKDGGVRFVVSHSSVLSAVEGSAFFRLDEWGTAILGYFMAGPPAL
jgi:hypothetical protein